MYLIYYCEFCLILINKYYLNNNLPLYHLYLKYMYININIKFHLFVVNVTN